MDNEELAVSRRLYRVDYEVFDNHGRPTGKTGSAQAMADSDLSAMAQVRSAHGDTCKPTRAVLVEGNSADKEGK